MDEGVLNKMRKPKNNDFEYFTEVFNESRSGVGKKQFIVPYFIASHPGSDVNAMIELALFLKRNGYKPDAVQDFIPAPWMWRPPCTTPKSIPSPRSRCISPRR